MADIKRIVNVQIALNTTGISQEGFSTMICVGPHMHGLTRVSSYTDADQMLDDGYTADDALYKMVATAFMQSPGPTVVKVGRQQVGGFMLTVGQLGAASTYTLTVSSLTDDGTVRKKDYTYTNDGHGITEILQGLSAAITADKEAVVTVEGSRAIADEAVVGLATLPDPVQPTAATADEEIDSLHVVAKDPAKAVSIAVSDNLVAAMDASTEKIADTMSAVVKSDGDFYGIALAARDEDDVLAMSEWAESHEKLFGTSIGGDAVKNSELSTDTGSKLQAKNLYWTHWWYHELAATEYPECAVMARCFAIQPGGETWALKKLSGVTADPISETEYNAITKKNGNTFEKFRNLSITQNGKVAAGEWIDVIRFRDWLKEEVTVNVLNVMINADKVSYTDDGIGIIENQIRRTLQLGQDRGGIAPTEYDEDGNPNLGYTVSVPLVSNIFANQKASRILEDVKFTARLAGAIHVVDPITGSLTYENLIEPQA